MATLGGETYGFRAWPREEIWRLGQGEEEWVVKGGSWWCSVVAMADKGDARRVRNG